MVAMMLDGSAGTCALNEPPKIGSSVDGLTLEGAKLASTCLKYLKGASLSIDDTAHTVAIVSSCDVAGSLPNEVVDWHELRSNWARWDVTEKRADLSLTCELMCSYWKHSDCDGVGYLKEEGDVRFRLSTRCVLDRCVRGSTLNVFVLGVEVRR